MLKITESEVFEKFAQILARSLRIDAAQSLAPNRERVRKYYENEYHLQLGVTVPATAIR
jgi:hypothetical protein